MEMQSFLRSTGQNDVAKVSGNSVGKRFGNANPPYQRVVETEQITQCQDCRGRARWESASPGRFKLMLGTEEAGTQLVRSEAAPGCRSHGIRSTTAFHPSNPGFCWGHGGTDHTNRATACIGWLNFEPAAAEMNSLHVPGRSFFVTLSGEKTSTQTSHPTIVFVRLSHVLSDV